MSDNKKPVVFKGLYCDDKCPFFRCVFKPTGYKNGWASCTMLNIDLDYYDGWLAACTKDKSSP